MSYIYGIALGVLPAYMLSSPDTLVHPMPHVAIERVLRTGCPGQLQRLPGSAGYLFRIFICFP